MLKMKGKNISDFFCLSICLNQSLRKKYCSFLTLIVPPHIAYNLDAATEVAIASIVS